MTSRHVVIFDLDGTLALIDHRRYLVEGEKKDWDAFFAACVDDVPNRPVVEMLDAIVLEHCVEIWSGRSDEVRDATMAWLKKNVAGVQYVRRVRMRSSGDYTPDEVLKRQWLGELRKTKEDVLMVFDDRDKVVSMWRSEGICCAQVAPGDF